jgi:uncharacterized protein
MMRGIDGPGPQVDLKPGTPLTIRRHKWPDRDHYTAVASVLGSDSWGVWAGMRRGAWWYRDGQPVHQARSDLVELLPIEVGWAAEWYEQRPGGPDFELYCDVTGPLSWSGTVVTMVDLDLDVIRTFAGETRLLDEDEFELHRVALDYPASMVALARETAAQLMDRVSRREPPFDGSHRPWLELWKRTGS